MRALPILMIIPGLLCLVPAPARAEMDRESCRIAANLEDMIASAVRRHSRAVGELPPPVALSQSRQPDLKAQAQRVADAHAAYVAAARAYVETVEGMAQQYRQCAR